MHDQGVSVLHDGSVDPNPTDPQRSASAQGSLGRHQKYLAVAALTLLVVGVFFPIVGFEFVDYDVPGQVVDNPHIRGLTSENLKHIFTSRCVTSYYPVRTLSYALDYQLWGLSAGGFKLTNGLIHLANVLLVFWLVLRLYARWEARTKSPQPRYDLFLAAVSAGVFAVHPVVVEPVVWVAGREELLMTLGALGCVHFHLTARRLAEAGGKTRRVVACHALAAVSCAAACLSNAAGAVIPLLIAVWDVLTLERARFWRIVSGTAALWVVAGATIVIKVLSYSAEIITGPPLFSVERVMLVLKVYALNLKALVWPTDLAPARSQFDPRSFLEPAVLLGGVAAFLTCVMLWKLRGQKLALFGLLWFGVALFPGSQVVISHVHRADRFLYLPLAGLTLALAMSLRPAGHLIRRPMISVGLAAVAVWSWLLLSFVSAAQVQTWRNSLTMWQNCVRVEPDNALAHFALGNSLAQRGQYDEAMRHRDVQLALDLNDPEAMNVAALLAVRGTDSQPPNYELAVQLARRSCQLSRWDNPRYLHTLAIAHARLGQSLIDEGQLRRAVEQYRTALEADPNAESALLQLAVVLATSSDPQVRNPREAVQLAERAGGLKKGRPDSSNLIILATVYAEAWEFDKAIAAIESAIQLTESSGPAELLDELRRRLELYRKRIPPESLR
ncbi:MAG: tetratricopeptide repeat protein [Planctomycetaceae bacterium]|nr:tetratricopeptide repeat protein [Planctomycetaceae bacterium]